MKKIVYILSAVFALVVFFACVTSQKISNTEESFKASGLSVRIPKKVQTVDTVSSATFAVNSAGAAAVPAEKPGTEARGRITIYTSMYEEVFPAIEAAMEKHFPDLDVFFVYGGTGQIQMRIEAEIINNRTAGTTLGCDIVLAADPSYSIELKEKGILHPFASREARNLSFYFDPEGYWYPVRVSNMVFAYNPDKYKKDQVPQMFYEFAYSPDLKGALSMGDPATSGTSLVTMNALWDRYMGEKYFEALGAQRVQIDTYPNALTKVEKGQIKAAMILEETVLRKNQTEGTKLEIIYPSDGAVVVPSTIMVINDQWSKNKNTQSATAIAEWFLSEEGQAVIVSGWMHSVRRNFAHYPEGSKPTAQITVDAYPVVWENVYKQRDEIRSNFNKLVRRR